MQDNIEQIIKDWVTRSYGESEADNPSWDIQLLAKEIAKLTKQMN